MDSFDAAAEALAAANRGDSAPEAAPEQVEVAAPEVGAGTTSNEDSFANIDPNLLPPELQAQYRNMQGAFTKRMQEVAEQAKQYQSFGSPEEVAEAVQLRQALQNDPVYVHQQLSAYLQANGMSPAEANAAATEAINEQAEAADPFETEEDRALKALQQEIEGLKNWKTQTEAVERERIAMAKIQREEMDIRQRNPDLKQEDIDDIYALAFAHDGSLLRAEQAFKAQRDRWAAGYVAQKASVPAGVSSPSATGGAQQPPQSYADLNDPALEAAATAALRAALGES